MATNLQELKSLQKEMRDQLLNIYCFEIQSMLKLSKEIGIPYTSFRGFMNGANLSYVNLNKIHKWLEKTPRNDSQGTN